MGKSRKKRVLGILRLTVLNGVFLLLCLVALVPVPLCAHPLVQRQQRSTLLTVFLLAHPAHLEN